MEPFVFDLNHRQRRNRGTALLASDSYGVDPEGDSKQWDGEIGLRVACRAMASGPPGLIPQHRLLLSSDYAGRGRRPANNGLFECKKNDSIPTKHAGRPNAACLHSKRERIWPAATTP
jgi:hypothetical protein